MKGFSRFARFEGFARFSRFGGFSRFAGVAAGATIVVLLQGASVHTQPPRNFIWKITAPRGALYLVGSVHLLTKDYYPLSPALDAAFKDSDLLVEEADPGELESLA